MTSPGKNPVIAGSAAARGETVLAVEGLSVSYQGAGNPVRAVTDVTIHLRRGEIYGIAGESGSGKSTLLQSISRLLKYPGVIDSGAVSYFGRDGERVDVLKLQGEQLRRFRWARIAMVFQSALNALNPVQTIGYQLEDVLKDHRPAMRKAARRERAAEVLRLVGVPATRLSAYPHQLSGGQRQRVMIAMALILEPDVVLMDEPTTALDVVTQRQILRELVRLRDTLGFAVVFITHDLSLLLEIADRISVMYAGRVVERGIPGELLEHPAHPYSAGLINSFPPLSGPRTELTGVPGYPPDLRELPPGCSFEPRCEYAHEACRVTQPPLLRLADRGAAGHEAACLLNGGQGLQALAEPFSYEERNDG
jgi:peptide/nickel transport system ATP-binding protein